jgi:hypothetical protein
MGQISVSYSQVKKSYPALVKEIETKIRNSKSKAKNDPMSSFSWSYHWVKQFNGAHFEFDALSIEDKVRDTASLCTAWVQVSKGKITWSSGCCLPLPTEIKDVYRKQYINGKVENKQIELDDLLRQLNKLLVPFTPGV